MALSSPTSLAALFRSRRLRRAFGWTVGLFAAFNLLVFLAAPPLLKSVLEQKLGEALHRRVHIGTLAFNPYDLSLEAADFSVQGTEGQELAGFDSLYLDLESASLLEGGPVIREVRLAGPRLQLTRLGPGRYDVADLIEEWSKPSDSPTPRFSVSNIQIGGGRMVFVDKPVNATHVLGDMVLGLPFLSNLPAHADIFVEPHFSARVDGAPLVLKGRSKPFADSHESELSIALDHVDLARYLPYSPVRLPFELRGGSLDTDLKLVFRQDKGKPGRLKLSGAARIRNLALAEGDQALLAWKELEVRLREADLLQGSIAVDTVRLAGLDGHVRVSPQGQVNWLAFADRLAAPAADGKAGDGGKPLAWSVGEIAVEDGALHYQDQGRKNLPVQVVDRIQARIRGLASAADQALALTLAARINGSGSLEAGGEVGLRPLAASLDVDAKDISLLPVQPYFGEKLNLTLTSGRVSGHGRLDFEAGEKGPGGGFKGELSLADLRSLDKANNADFLKWKTLFIGGIDARLRPLALSVGEVALSDFYARLIVSPQGRLNLTQIVRPPEGPASGPAGASAPDEGETLPIRIGKVSLQGGTVNFSDYFVKPNYTVNVTRIGGRVSGLSSAPGTLADLELRGNYGNGAPVEVLAKLNPFAAKAYLDLKGEIRGVDLTTLSTYSGKYAGYAIDEGKLSLFVTYKLDHDQLTADNRVFLDQLSFGDRVDSPDATSLPVKLAIALLKNGRGEIDVNLPISGSIDDPEFSLGGVVLRVIGNLFAKVATSPFTFLSSLFGGGEELSSLDFLAGQAVLGPVAVKRLEVLARAMGERPGLKLEIAGRAEPETDREGLKRLTLDRAVKAEKLKDLGKKAVAESRSPDDVAIEAREYPVYLQRAYREAKFPKPRNLVGLPKDLPVEEMEKLMLANVQVGEEELRQLALRRAEAAQAWLAGEGKVPLERLFLLAPRLGGAEGKGAAARVDFSLR